MWNDAGSIQAVRGAYNSKTGTVDFTAPTSRSMPWDIARSASRMSAPARGTHAPITFCAARSITNGTSTTTFSPDAAVTRGQFIVMLMRAYGIEPDANPTGNFTDRITLTTSQRRKNSASRTASATICLRLKTKSAGRKCLRCSTVRSTN